MTRILYDRADPGPKVTGAYELGIGDKKRKKGRAIKPPRYDPELPGLRSFFGRSWIEFPDSSSVSRVMKARCVVGRSVPLSGIYSVVSDRRRKNGRRLVRTRSHDR